MAHFYTYPRTDTLDFQWPRQLTRRLESFTLWAIRPTSSASIRLFASLPLCHPVRSCPLDRSMCLPSSTHLPVHPHPLICSTCLPFCPMSACLPVRLFFAPIHPFASRPSRLHFQKITNDFVVLNSYLSSVCQVSSPHL